MLLIVSAHLAKGGGGSHEGKGVNSIVMILCGSASPVFLVACMVTTHKTPFYNSGAFASSVCPQSLVPTTEELNNINIAI